METRFRGENHHPFGMNSVDLRAVGKRTLEWDLNDWKWDGDLFIASPLNPVPDDHLGRQFFPLGAGNSSNSSSSCSDEGIQGIEKGKRELEKKRRVIVVDDHNSYEAAGGLSLKLCNNGFSVHEREVGNWEGTIGKKTKFGAGSSNRAVCQVEDCGADLSGAKDYHRRHKVCEMHSKASGALVGNVMQRFCQQCSRFHVLQEFDEGKRSCRRRLAGHNKRRRKANPSPVSNGSSLNDDQTSGYLLISLLRILSNMHSNRSDQKTDQDLLSHLLRSLASPAGENGGRSIAGLLQDSQNIMNQGTSVGNPEVVSALIANGQVPPGPFRQHLSVSVSEMPQQGPTAHNARGAEVQDGAARQIEMNNFDLNDIYVDSDDGTEDVERPSVPANLGDSSLDCPSWVQIDSQQSSPPQTSGNSDSASAQSPSSSSGDAQSRTDRIVFKLFGKEPNDFPCVLRAQILEWLSHIPTDMESYTRPGCVILTIYIRQAEAVWEELCCDLTFSLRSLLDLYNDSFWTTGWVYVRVQHQIAFIYSGHVVVDTSLPLRSNSYSQILTVKPIAISASERAQFSIKGINLSRPATRLLCAVERKYMVQETTDAVMDDVDSFKDYDELQCVNFSCSIPTVTVRGFHSSFRTTQGGLSLNIDVSTTMIIQPGPIFDFLIANQHVRDPYAIDWAKAKRTLKNLRIKVAPSNQEYKITGLSEKPCREQMFSLKQKNVRDEDGEVQSQELTVYDYFVNHHSMDLRYSADIPCINVGKPKRPTYTPLKLCSLVSLQRYTKALNTLQRALLVEKSRQKPQERMNTLSNVLRNGKHDAEPMLRSCGISISTNFAKVEPTKIERWAVVNFSARCDIRSLVRDLKKMWRHERLEGVSEYKYSSYSDLELLNKWKGLPDCKWTWESCNNLQYLFPQSHLEDKVPLDGRGNVRTHIFIYFLQEKRGYKREMQNRKLLS